jgi:ABC-2 type transport system ATP-binding protein
MAATCRRDYAKARRQLGVVPQELVFDPFFNVRESLRIQSGYFGIKNNDDWIDELLRKASVSPTRPRPACASSRAA